MPNLVKAKNNLLNFPIKKQQSNKLASYFAIRKQGTHQYLSNLTLAGTCEYSNFPSALQFHSHKTAHAFNQIVEGQIVECTIGTEFPIIKGVY